MRGTHADRPSEGKRGDGVSGSKVFELIICVLLPPIPVSFTQVPFLCWWADLLVYGDVDRTVVAL